MAETAKIALVQEDGWLDPYHQDLVDRHQRYLDKLQSIESSFGSLYEFASRHHYLGFNYDKDKGGYFYREWAPAASKLELVGEFNNWSGEKHTLQNIGDGIWEIFINGDELKIGEQLKVRITSDSGIQDRIPAYINYAIQHPETHDFSAVLTNQNSAFEWSDNDFDCSEVKSPLIYEAHTGIAQEKEGVGSWKEFEENVLPRIKDLGYNVIQLMAVQEHPYYGSFGYHVSNFFACSSRFGTPEDLKSLVNAAHKMGIAVIMDIVHSHAVKNIAEGLNEFDGSDDQYFHPGERGYHVQWDSKCFNYGKEEVLRFLLSNVRYWMEEYHFDGFRFDGVTSMLYFNHGITDFDHYDKYFKDGVEWDAILYLQLANKLIKDLKPGSLSIAEDMSGMPGLCRLPEDGGIGFDYRLGMGIPDYWIKILKHVPDEEWSMNEIWDILTNRRWKEKTISYSESHDQALVGDKTLAFWLMDQEMYWHMKKGDNNLVVDRGLALHKLIRLATISLGGEGYLNFMGNEFGHPEWIDFPREGNDWSYKHARRQWSLVDNDELKYSYFNAFDKEMVTFFKESGILNAENARQINMDDTNKCFMFERGEYIFAFNFHVANSIFNYRFKPGKPGSYKIVLNTDQSKFGGPERIDDQMIYSTDEFESLSLYMTNRTGLVLKRLDD